MSNIHILIIEDEAIIAEDISDILKSLQYDVAGIFHDSDRAIDYLSFHSPDLVLCDIQIKGSMDGIELAKKVSHNKKIPFIFVTSFSDKATLDRAKQTLPYGYIVKPFNDKDLLTAIELALFRFSQELEQLSLTKEKIEELTNSSITDQEFKIILHIINGLNNDKICKEMFFSINTLKYHMKNILSKFEVSHRGDIMQLIVKNFLIRK